MTKYLSRWNKAQRKWPKSIQVPPTTYKDRNVGNSTSQLKCYSMKAFQPLQLEKSQSLTDNTVQRKLQGNQRAILVIKKNNPFNKIRNTTQLKSIFSSRQDLLNKIGGRPLERTGLNIANHSSYLDSSQRREVSQLATWFLIGGDTLNKDQIDREKSKYRYDRCIHLNSGDNIMGSEMEESDFSKLTQGDNLILGGAHGNDVIYGSWNGVTLAQLLKDKGLKEIGYIELRGCKNGGTILKNLGLSLKLFDIKFIGLIGPKGFVTYDEKVKTSVSNLEKDEPKVQEIVNIQLKIKEGNYLKKGSTWGDGLTEMAKDISEFHDGYNENSEKLGWRQSPISILQNTFDPDNFSIKLISLDIPEIKFKLGKEFILDSQKMLNYINNTAKDAWNYISYDELTANLGFAVSKNERSNGPNV